MDNLLKYHLKQSLGLAIVSILFMVALNILAMVVPALGILGLLSLAILVFWIIGMINAANAVTNPYQ